MEAGDEGTSLLKFDFETGGTLNGEPLPEQEIPAYTSEFTTTIDDVTADQIEASVVYGEIRVKRGDADPALAAQIESALSALEGVRGTLTLAPSGALIDGSFDEAEGLDPVLESTLSQTTEQLRSITVPFPQEEVGMGASWRVETSFEVFGVTSDQSATYTLTELRGDEYSLGVKIDQVIQPGEVEGGGEITGGELTGVARVNGSLATPFAQRASGENGGAITSVVPTSDEESAEFVQEVDVNFEMEPAGGD